MLGLRYFTMLCNDAEYKNMDQDKSLGQLYDEHIWIKIYYKQSGWAYYFLQHNAPPPPVLRIGKKFHGQTSANRMKPGQSFQV